MASTISPAAASDRRLCRIDMSAQVTVKHQRIRMTENTYLELSRNRFDALNGVITYSLSDPGIIVTHVLDRKWCKGYSSERYNDAGRYLYVQTLQHFKIIPIIPLF